MKTKIQNSVLPLNQDGSVYHLHLLPEDVADTIILVGDPDRVALISRHFSSVEVKKQHRQWYVEKNLEGKKLKPLLEKITPRWVVPWDSHK